jgi:hypothetical protein
LRRILCGHLRVVNSVQIISTTHRSQLGLYMEWVLVFLLVIFVENRLVYALLVVVQVAHKVGPKELLRSGGR